MLNKTDSQYHALLQMLVNKIGEERDDRTGTGTVSVFGHQMRFNLQDQFPILTTKSVHFKSIASELNWFLRGATNIKYLLERNNHIWTDWRYKNYLKTIGLAESPDHPMYISKEVFEKRIVENENFALIWGDIGKGYGHQWRNFGEYKHNNGFKFLEGFDQISWVINEIKTNPNSRRLIVSGWNPHEVDKVDLPPCHTLFQFFVEPLSENERLDLLKSKASYEKWLSKENARTRAEWLVVCDLYAIPRNKLSCQLYQRSADVFLGVPFNIASYALLTHIIAKECGLAVGDFVWTGGDVHLYSNHYEQAKLQLSRMSTPCKPTLTIPVFKALDAYDWDDFKLTDYIPHDAIKAPVAV